MGGLKTKSDSNIKYVKLKDGNFYLSKDESNTPFEELGGRLVDLQLRDEEYQGTPVRKLYLSIVYDAEKYIIGLSFDSAYTSTFLGFLKNANLDEDIALHPRMKKDIVNGKDVTRYSLLVSQNGSFLKSAFTKESPNGLPAMKKIKISGKELWDKTDMLDFYEQLILKEFKPKLSPQTVVNSAPVKLAAVANGVEDEDLDNDLPF